MKTDDTLESRVRGILQYTTELPYAQLQRKYNCSLVQLLQLKKQILAESDQLRKK